MCSGCKKMTSIKVRLRGRRRGAVLSQAVPLHSSSSVLRSSGATTRRMHRSWVHHEALSDAAAYRGVGADLRARFDRLGDVWRDAVGWYLLYRRARGMPALERMLCGQMDWYPPSIGDDGDDENRVVVRANMYATLSSEDVRHVSVLLEFFRLDDDYESMISDARFALGQLETWKPACERMLASRVQGKDMTFEAMTDALIAHVWQVQARNALGISTVVLPDVKLQSFPYRVHNADGSFDGFLQEDSVVTARDVAIPVGYFALAG